MADQTPVNRINGRYRSSPSSPPRSSEQHSHGVRQLLADITELVELQFRLLTADVSELRQRISPPIIATAIGLAIVLGAMPVLLLAAAAALYSQAGWELWLACLTAGGAGAVVGVATLAIGYNGFKRIAVPLERSSNELAKSIASLREMFNKTEAHSPSNKPK